MLNVSKYLSNLYDSQDLPNGNQRRAELIEEMANLEQNSKDCASCSGLCCTFIANSMQTDPIQTLEIYNNLQSSDSFDAELVELLEDTVKNNRLDYEISTGKNSSFRRTYTCPFLNKGPKGCALSRKIKPYGCLGFNPNEVAVSEKGHCSVNIGLLSARERQFEALEDEINRRIKSDLALDWDKYPMPLALLKLHEAVKKYDS